MIVRLITKRWPESTGQELVEKELSALAIGQTFDVVRVHEDGAYTLKGLKYSYPASMFVEIKTSIFNKNPPPPPPDRQIKEIHATTPPPPIISVQGKLTEEDSEKLKKAWEDFSKALQEAKYIPLVVENDPKTTNRFLWGFLLGLVTAIALVIAAFYIFIPHI